MTEENFAALRKVRVEAKRLNVACAAQSGTSAILHIAYDREVERLKVSDAILLGGLSAIQ